jgi:hypothetical protein
MSLTFQYKSELESVTLLGPDGARLINTACKLSRLAAGMQAIRTMAKFMDPTNPFMITSLTCAIELACNPIDEVKNSPVRRCGTLGRFGAGG